MNIGGVDYHALYAHVATKDEHIPYWPMNTSDTDYDNPIKHVALEATCFEFEAQYDRTVTQRAANDSNDTHCIAITTQNTVHTLSKRMRAMDCDDQLDNDKVLDDVGDEQELRTLPKSTWENIIDPTPPFENPIQRTWDTT